MSFMDILKQYANPSDAHRTTSAAHFDEVAHNAPPAAIGSGVAAAFRSDQTPPFPNMVGQLFEQSSGQQQAGVLNQLLGSINPAMLAGLAGGVLNRLGVTTSGTNSTPPTVTPAQASQLTPSQVQEIAAHAQQQDPGIIDKVGSFYGEHPQLVKSLGAIALALVLGRMANKS